MINPWRGDTAVYVQLADLLRRQIDTGVIAPGQALPSESRLGQEYGLGRHTVRQAVGLLRAEGLVTFVKGLGMMVREPERRQVLAPASGSEVTARMPTRAEQAEFGLDDGVPVFVVAGPGTEQVFPADRWMLRWP